MSRHIAQEMRRDSPRLYRIDLIHWVYGWDASFKFRAADAKQARRFAKMKLVNAENWIITRARLVK